MISLGLRSSSRIVTPATGLFKKFDRSGDLQAKNALLPVQAPAYLYRNPFNKTIESSLSKSFFSFPPSSPSSREEEYLPSSPVTVVVDCPPHQHYRGRQPPPPLSIPADAKATKLLLPPSDATPAATMQLQQVDNTNKPYEYPSPFDQLLVTGKSELGKVMLAADFGALVALIASRDKNASLRLCERIVSLLLVLSILELFFALLLQELYPIFAMVSVLLGIGCSFAALCTLTVAVLLPDVWDMVLLLIVALSIMALITAICWKRINRPHA